MEKPGSSPDFSNIKKLIQSGLFITFVQSMNKPDIPILTFVLLQFILSEFREIPFIILDLQKKTYLCVIVILVPNSAE